ncbi:hypothetical protein [uncultured Imperialibacter sp.]|uniref:hypothetical protein n=2 Tax=Imperialibacter TaxID=1649461 RepID=UPI0030DD353C|tara:strand:- start:39006 stop:39227 length:222 start_codon:yes stop_codon:yes gene_type:complete
MKNEERIIELLMEYISRTDKMEKEFKEEMVQLRRDFNQTNSRQEALMQEIFKLSKRVGKLEDESQRKHLPKLV